MKEDTNLNIHVPDAHFGQRSLYRASMSGLSIVLYPKMQVFKIINISSGGLSFNANKTIFKQNEDIAIKILVSGKSLINKVEATVVRFAPTGSTAIVFKPLNERDTLTLDKLILEIQKKKIEFQKKRDPSRTKG